MWEKLNNLKKIDETGIVLVIRLGDEQEALKVAEAAIEGGIKALEITMSVPNALGIIKMANCYQAITISGAFTPTEFYKTLEAGADIVKLFPAEFVGPAYVKTVKAPLKQTPILPMGGITPENAKEWFRAGATCLGVGSFITKAAQKDGDYTKVTQAAKLFLKVVKESRFEE